LRAAVAAVARGLELIFSSGVDVALLLLEVSLEGERRLALALEIIGVVAHAVPSLIGTTSCVCLPHKVGTLLVIHYTSPGINAAGWDDGSTLERNMVLQRVLNELAWGGANRFLVGGLNSSYRRVLLVDVAAGQCGIIGTSMVVSAANGVERVNDIRLMGTGSTTVGTLSGTSVALN
jgi:hypothetical protein